MGVPKTKDGRPVISPCVFEDGTFLFVTGAGDHPTNGRGEGADFVLSRTTAGETPLEWQFNDWVQAVGGTGKSSGGVAGDTFSLEIYAPATELEADAVTGTVILYDTGFQVEGGAPLKVILPVPEGYGTHNVVTPVPVPVSVGEQGYWRWNQPDFGLGEVTEAPGTPEPNDVQPYNLYDQPVPLARPATHLQLLADRNISIVTQNVKPMILLPHWKFKASLKTTTDHAVSVAWEMQTVRMRSTKIW